MIAVSTYSSGSWGGIRIAITPLGYSSGRAGWLAITYTSLYTVSSLGIKAYALLLTYKEWSIVNVYYWSTYALFSCNHRLLTQSLVCLRGELSVVDWGTMLQAARCRVQFRMRSLDSFFNLPNPSSRTVALMFTQPVTEMSTRNLHGGVRSACA
jgi:hypothetical protein